MAEAAPDLAVRGLGVRARRGRVILDLPALDLPGGSALGIAGPSGAGKSTLLFALAGLAERTSGAVHWGGQDLLSLPQGARAAFRAQGIGLVFQDFLLFDELGPAANAAVLAQAAPRSRRAPLRRRAAEMLDRLGIAATNRRVASFSGGERQRVAVARALAHDPPILLADEPTASLHREAADALTDDLLAEVRLRRRTLIVASHDARLLDRMDRVLMLTDGRAA